MPENISALLRSTLARLGHTEAFAVCEDYSPPEGFNERDLHRLLEKVGSPSGGEDLGKCTKVKFIFVITKFYGLSNPLTLEDFL